MKKTMKIILTAVLVISIATTSALAAPDESGRDSTLSVSLTIHHNIGPDGDIISGSPLGEAPKPLGVPVPDSKWQIQLVTAPPAWDGKLDFETWEFGIDPTWLGAPILRVTNADGEAFFGVNPDDEDDVNNIVLAQGIYLVRELEADFPSGAIANPFLVSLPYFWNGEWIYDVHTFPKDPTNPIIVKKFDDISFNDKKELVITWTISFDIRLGLDTMAPISEESDTYIKVVDQLDTRLTYVPNSLVVTYDSGTSVAPLTLTLPESDINGTNWRITVIPPTSGTTDANTMYIDFLDAGRSQIAENGRIGEWVYLTFQTIAKIGEGDLGDIVNEAEMFYSNNHFIHDDPPWTTVYGLRINKVNVAGTFLAGATFELYEENDVNTVTNTLNAGVTGADAVASGTTGADGRLLLTGLIPGTYYLLETAAPTGYRLLPGLMKVVIGDDVIAPHIVDVTVTNDSGFRLPLTGGRGILLFTVVGLALIGGSIILIRIVVNMKKKDR